VQLGRRVCVATLHPFAGALAIWIVCTIRVGCALAKLNLSGVCTCSVSSVYTCMAVRGGVRTCKDAWRRAWAQNHHCGAAFSPTTSRAAMDSNSDGTSLPVSDPDSLAFSEDRGRSLFSRAWHGVMDSGSPAVAFARAFGIALALGLGFGIASTMPMSIAFKYFAMGHVTGVAVAVGLARAATRRQQQLAATIAASAGRRRERELEAHARRLEPHPIWEWPQHWVMLGPCHAWSYGGGAPGSHSAFAAAPHEAFRRELNTRWAVIAGTYDGAVMPLGPMLQDFDGCLDEVVCYMGPSLNNILESRYAEFAVGRRDGWTVVLQRMTTEQFESHRYYRFPIPQVAQSRDRRPPPPSGPPPHVTAAVNVAVNAAQRRDPPLITTAAQRRDPPWITTYVAAARHGSDVWL
jgi:hypothetical protein